jgi:hypothetical protein
VSDKLTCRFRQGFVCRNLPEFGGRATPARRFERLKGGAPTLAPARPPRHHPDMGREPTNQCKSDLFSAAGVENTSPPATNPASSANARPHVLPKDLPNAVKHLNDEELDRLLVVTLAEAKRRGRDTTPTDKRFPSRKVEAPVSLTRGQLNAVRAAFKAGITPTRIARQFGLSQGDVRAALKSDKGE